MTVLVNLMTKGGIQYWTRIKDAHNKTLSEHIDRLIEEKGQDILPIDQFIPFFKPLESKPKRAKAKPKSTSK